MMRTMYLVQHVRRKVWRQRIPALLHHPGSWTDTSAVPDLLCLHLYYLFLRAITFLFSSTLYFPFPPSLPLLCRAHAHSLYIVWWPPVHVCLHMWSQKRVTGILGRLCFCVEVSMSQQDWILPWSLTLHRASCSPQLSVYIGGLPRSFPRAPKHLQLRCRREWLFGRGRRARVQPSPQNPPKVFTLANSPAQQCKSPVHPSQTSGPLSRCLDATNKLLFIY